MLAKIRGVFERYGFEPLDTPAIEYTDALGKFLPDQDRPNEGVFSFKDDDEQWLSLRYDLTAPLARYVAENYQSLPKPFRRYQVGPVWRNEKPGPGRFRQFTQFDADTVGASSVAADAELCMLAADTLEALGVPRGQYVVKVNNRKVLDGVMEAIGLDGAANAAKRLIVLRAIDKLDRLGIDGVRAAARARDAKTRAATSPRARASTADQAEQVILAIVQTAHVDLEGARQRCSRLGHASFSACECYLAEIRQRCAKELRSLARLAICARAPDMTTIGLAVDPPSCAASNITPAPCSRPS